MPMLVVFVMIFLSGIHSGVNGTPTFYINGIRYNDSWDLESLLNDNQ